MTANLHVIFMTLLIIALAPILIIMFYIYFRDKYEKEPIWLLLVSLLLGALIILPVVIIEKILTGYSIHFSGLCKACYEAFVVAGFTEELFKWFAVFILIWRNKNFNEQFDGIVYSVFISLGFAMIENILYVTEGGLKTGILRSFTAVPFHAIAGVVMGFYFGLARFESHKRKVHLFFAFLLPFILHGIYDFCLLSGNILFILLWIPFMVFVWKNAFKKIAYLSKISFFKIKEGFKE